jgi:hypothetical protein
MATWHRAHAFAPNATFPWHTPQYSPALILAIVIGAVPFAI